MKRKQKLNLSIVKGGRSNPARDILVADAVTGLLTRNAAAGRTAVENTLAEVVVINPQEVEAERIRQEITELQEKLGALQVADAISTQQVKANDKYKKSWEIRLKEI